MLNIPPGFVNVGLSMTLEGDPEPMLVTFGFDATAYGGDLSALTADIGNALTISDVILETNSDISFTGVRYLVGQDGAPPQTVEVPFGAAQPGGDDVPMVPQNTAYLIRKFGVEGGRQGRGRMYVPGVAEGVVSNAGTISTAAAAAIGGRWQEFFNLLESDAVNPGGQHVILHTVGTPVQTPTQVIAVACDTLVATQRNRLRR